MLGVSLWTLRLYVARGALRATHVGRRVLIPMEVLEKVTVEGVKRKECVKKPLLRRRNGGGPGRASAP